MLSQLDDLRLDDNSAVRLLRVLLEVSLVIILGSVEGFERFGLSYDGSIPDSRCIDFLDDLLSSHFLFVVMVEDDRTILTANIIALTVQCLRVMHREEDLQDLSVRDHLGVEGDLNDLRVSCSAGADLLIGRIHYCPAGVA